MSSEQFNEKEKGRTSKVPQFRKDDPNGWYQEYQGYMVRHNMAHLALTTNRPAGGNPATEWDKRNAYCLSYLQEAVTQPQNRGPKSVVFAHEHRESTAKDLCDALINKYHIRDPRAIHAAQESFTGLRLIEGEKATSFLVRIEEGREVLRRLGKDLDERVDLVGRLITGIEKDQRYA